ncbi:hypothetical protein [Tenacibaculum sp. SG-28]|uniref:hypothetical protein n=1 Tax=Tenacibaculum sp. SG-28 TaxID=754426 RepID=UPI000CF39B3A|nr:hypothetical protein [Tenacibaculum sp. SG-28]PQJ21571.1 hypothetical protein BSU00_05525 [Tenacibaculum sp. SG-28]
MKTTIALMVSVLMFVGCSDLNTENYDTQLQRRFIENGIPEGDYTGTFSVVYNNGETYSNPVTISFFNDYTFNSSDGPMRYPAGGNGSYEITEDAINFTDLKVWTADFDWNLILNGKYHYTIQQNKLIIYANKNKAGTYTYTITFP